MEVVTLCLIVGVLVLNCVTVHYQRKARRLRRMLKD